MTSPSVDPQPRSEAAHGGLPGYLRDAWSQAIVAAGDARDEVQKILARVGGWTEVGPEEGRRLANELAERLKRERAELEGSVEAAVRRAVAPFQRPSKDELAAIDARLATIEARLEKLAQARARKPREAR